MQAVHSQMQDHHVRKPANGQRISAKWHTRHVHSQQCVCGTSREDTTEHARPVVRDRQEGDNPLVSQENFAISQLIHACASGNTAARRQFQEEYGEDIYNFPLKIYRVSPEEAGDFYVYVFKKDRIFTRIKTFAGRNNIQFRTFLSYYVLKHLFLGWQRARKEIETFSLHSPIPDSMSDGRTLEDVLPDLGVFDSESARLLEEGPTSDVWSSLGPEERLLLKLLSLLEYDLDPEDNCLLANMSGRSIEDTLALVTEVQEELRRKDEKLAHLQDELDTVWGWVLLRQKELREIGEKIILLAANENAARQEQLLHRKQELEQALVKRQRQKDRLVKEIRTYKLTTPYKDLAQLLNLPVGTVGARVCRLRARLLQKLEEKSMKKRCTRRNNPSSPDLSPFFHPFDSEFGAENSFFLVDPAWRVRVALSHNRPGYSASIEAPCI